MKFGQYHWWKQKYHYLIDPKSIKKREPLEKLCWPCICIGIVIMRLRIIIETIYTLSIVRFHIYSYFFEWRPVSTRARSMQAGTHITTLVNWTCCTHGMGALSVWIQAHTDKGHGLPVAFSGGTKRMDGDEAQAWAFEPNAKLKTPVPARAQVHSALWPA
jgi:hypothetical protein